MESHLATELHIRNRDCAGMGSGRKDRGFSNLPGVSTLQHFLSTKNKCIILIYLPKYSSNFLMSYCITGNRKKQLYRLSQSQNNCTKYPVLLETLEPVIRSGWEVWDPAVEQFLSTQCSCHSVLCHAGSCCLIIIFIIDFLSLFLLPWERVSWTFFRLSLCQFSE